MEAIPKLHFSGHKSCYIWCGVLKQAFDGQGICHQLQGDTDTTEKQKMGLNKINSGLSFVFCIVSVLP